MRNRVVTAAAIAAMTLTDMAPAHAMPLPQDKAERATLCSRAALVHASHGENADPTERDRRDGLLRSTIDATGYFDAVGLDEEAGFARLAESGEIQQIAYEGNWLTTLNACKQAYSLGAAEPVARLPTDPADRPAACGAVALVRAVGAAGGDAEAASQGVMRDPQSAYFQLFAVFRAGDQDKADAAMSRQIDWAVTTGSIDALTQQCLEAFPAAGRFVPAPLPADRGTAGAACAFNAGVFIGLGGAAGERAKRLEEKLRAIETTFAPALVDSNAKLIEQALTLGPPFDILAACEARFG
ncbi:hypothetical protein [Sphingopyxis sp. KK2]|uniref:hypothetical protein n=1 Tax=Sphingopyxis sp. KK2 TaxID=1855727 RepID=UPI00097E5976|nr:hypothetical protein [Sphingopyxis sp. KK2]